MKRIKGNLQIVIPLIFSSLERIDTVSTAMELRRFGKIKSVLGTLSKIHNSGFVDYCGIVY